MSIPNTTCRVCDKEYFCCSDSRNTNSWKAMACSQECYKEYMRRIEISRRPKVEETNEEQPIVKMRYSKKKTINEVIKTEDIIED